MSHAALSSSGTLQAHQRNMQFSGESHGLKCVNIAKLHLDFMICFVGLVVCLESGNQAWLH